MISVLAATATELTKLQPIGRSFLILSRNVVAAFAFVTLKDNVISRHILNPVRGPLSVDREVTQPPPTTDHGLLTTQ